MKGYGRKAAAALALGLVLSLSACQFATSTTHLDEVYKPAFANCLEQIDTLFPDLVINTAMVSPRYLRQEEEARVTLLDTVEEAYFETHEEHHWVFLIGDSAGFDYVQMVCSSTTNELIGYLTVN